MHMQNGTDGAAEAGGDPATVARRYFRALAAGDQRTLGDLLAEDAVWHQPGRNRFSGRHEGAAAVAALVAGMLERSGGTLRVEPSGEPMPNGELVAVPVRFRAERDGARLDAAGVDLLTVREGRIVRVALFSADGPGEDRFWGA